VRQENLQRDEAAPVDVATINARANRVGSHFHGYINGAGYDAMTKERRR
jgi:hypothetical protein